MTEKSKKTDRKGKLGKSARSVGDVMGKGGEHKMSSDSDRVKKVRD